MECAAGAAASRHFLLSSPRSPRIVAERNRTRRFFSFFFWKNSKNRFEKEFLSTGESSLSLSLSLIDSQGKTDGRDGRRRWDRWGKFVKSIYRGS